MKARLAKKKLAAILGHTKPIASKDIQTWINQHFQNDRLIWNQDGVNQACRFRDLFADCIATSYEEYRDCASVVGEHTSKSVVLPVVQLRANDLTVVLRDNFHDVVVSVVGLKFPLRHQMQTFLAKICCRGYQDRVSFFQGFPDDMRLGSYKENYRAFSVEVPRWTDAYALLRIIGALQAGRDAESN